MVTLPCRKKFVILQTEKRTKKTIEIWNTNTIITKHAPRTCRANMSIATNTGIIMSTTTIMSMATVTTTITRTR